MLPKKTQITWTYLIEEQNFSSKPSRRDLSLECWLVKFAFNSLLLGFLAGLQRIGGGGGAAPGWAVWRDRDRKHSPESSLSPRTVAGTYQSCLEKEKESSDRKGGILTGSPPKDTAKKSKRTKKREKPEAAFFTTILWVPCLQTWLTPLEKNVNFDLKKKIIALAAVTFWQQIAFLWSIFIWLRMYMHIHKYFVKSRRMLLSFLPTLAAGAAHHSRRAPPARSHAGGRALLEEGESKMRIIK